MDQTLYQTALVVHVAGITVMAGTTFIDAISFRQFWKSFPADVPKTLVLEEQLFKLQKYLGIGMLLILVSGITMMAFLHQVWGQQVWFRVKMILLLLVIFNGLAIRRRQGKKLKILIAVSAAQDGLSAEVSKLKRRVALAHLLQLMFFMVMYTLSIFKFN